MILKLIDIELGITIKSSNRNFQNYLFIKFKQKKRVLLK